MVSSIGHLRPIELVLRGDDALGRKKGTGKLGMGSISNQSEAVGIMFEEIRQSKLRHIIFI